MVRRLQSGSWSFASVLETALSFRTSALVAFDVPLGVPASYLAAAKLLWNDATNFLALVRRVAPDATYFESTTTAAEWRIDRPFFSVPAGIGGLNSYVDAARQQGVQLLRDIDRRTSARTLFAKAGIPGSVGSGTSALWRELGSELSLHRAFSVWPFEGSLENLPTRSRIVVAEIYPRAGYATALGAEAPHLRARLSISKTDDEVRREVVSRLPRLSWVLERSITLSDLPFAASNEDDFDACLTTMALLRCAIEDVPLSSPYLVDSVAEGGMLGTGSINLDLPEKTFRSALPVLQPATKIMRRSAASTGHSTVAASFACLIPGCTKVFHGSRGGWDGHVGSIRLHEGWHPEESDPEKRKELFQREFPEFFASRG
jgi:hypothetical protein